MFVHLINDRAISRIVRSVSGELAARGIDTTIICLAMDSGISVPDGVQVVELGSARSIRLAILGLARYLRRGEIDVVFAHGDGPARDAILARIVSRADIRLIPVVHNVHSEHPYSHRWLRDRIVVSLYPRADLVAGVSPGVIVDIETLSSRLVGMTTLIPEPAPQFERLSNAQSADHPWLDRPEIRLLISVGHFNPRKGHDVVLRAFSLIHGKDPSTRLLILGVFDNDEYVQGLRGLVESAGLGDVIEMREDVSEVIPFLAGSSVLLHGARSEAFGLVLVEALSVGLPVVATDCPGGPAWILGEGKYGRLVSVDDHVAMAKAAGDILDSSVESEELRRLATERASHFSLANIGRLYHEAASRSR